MSLSAVEVDLLLLEPFRPRLYNVIRKRPLCGPKRQ